MAAGMRARRACSPTRRRTTLPNADNWVHELNLDPRFRVPAGFGTKVVQNEQED